MLPRRDGGEGRKYSPSSLPLSSSYGSGFSSLSDSSGSGAGGYFGQDTSYLPPLSSTSSNYLPPLQSLSLDPLPPSRSRSNHLSSSGLGLSSDYPSLRERRSTNRLSSLNSLSVPSAAPSFLSSTHSTSFHLPPLPALLPLSTRTSSLSATPRRSIKLVNCICGSMSRDDEMLTCGSCKNESHISCVSSPGLARLLNPFICASCIGYNDRPGGMGGGFTSSLPSSTSLSSNSSPFPRQRSTTTTSLGSSDFNTPTSTTSSRRSASSSLSSSSSSLSPLSPLSPLSSLSMQSRPGGSIVNPDQKVFENKEQFTMWAKAMFITSHNKNAPMELKNTSYHTVTLSCRNARRGGDCLWLLRAELDPAARAKGPMAPAEGPWHLRDDLVYLEHSEMCVELTASRITRTRNTSRPSVGSHPLASPSFSSTSSSLGVLAPLGSLSTSLSSSRRSPKLSIDGTDFDQAPNGSHDDGDSLRFDDAIEGLGMLAASSTSSRGRRRPSMSGGYNP